MHGKLVDEQQKMAAYFVYKLWGTYLKINCGISFRVLLLQYQVRDNRPEVKRRTLDITWNFEARRIKVCKS